MRPQGNKQQPPVLAGSDTSGHRDDEYALMARAFVTQVRRVQDLERRLAAVEEAQRLAAAPPELLTTAEAARQLRRNPKTLLRAVRAGKLPVASRDGKGYLFSRDAVLTYGAQGLGGIQ